jgi:excisionase family DNA binding protein
MSSLSQRRNPRPQTLGPNGATSAMAGNPAYSELGQPVLDAERLAYSVQEAARLTGLSRDLLYDQMRRGNLSYIKIGRRRLITRQHLQQFIGLAS